MILYFRLFPEVTASAVVISTPLDTPFTGGVVRGIVVITSGSVIWITPIHTSAGTTTARKPGLVSAVSGIRCTQKINQGIKAHCSVNCLIEL